MNRIISDTAEYGCYLFDHACKPLLTDFMKTIETNVIGKPFLVQIAENTVLIAVNKATSTPIEETGAWLRASMTAMKNRINYKTGITTQ
jgi:ketol-acid reductoisomerase